MNHGEHTRTHGIVTSGSEVLWLGRRFIVDHALQINEHSLAGHYSTNILIITLSWLATVVYYETMRTKNIFLCVSQTKNACPGVSLVLVFGF